MICNKTILNFALKVFASLIIICASGFSNKLIVYPKKNGVDTKTIVLKLIKSAQKNIKMSAYQLRQRDIAKALIEKSESGVLVEIIIEPMQNPYHLNVTNIQDELIKKVKSAGIIVHNRPECYAKEFPKGIYHPKYIIIDDENFFVTTANFDDKAFLNSRDFAVNFDGKEHPIFKHNLLELFKRDTKCAGLESFDGDIVIVGPLDQREKVVRFINKAQKKIRLYQQFLHDPEIVELLIQKLKKGVAVKVIMMPYPLGYNRKDPNESTQKKLIQAGADLRMLIHRYVHGQVITIDDQQALLGSMGLTTQSLDHNRELSLVLKGSLLRQMVKQFKRDWQKTLEFNAARQAAKYAQRDWNIVRHNRR